MKKIIGEDNFDLKKCVLFFFIILIQSCASTSAIRLEDDDFEENLPGLWEGRWYYQGAWSGPERIKITGIDGSKVHLTGLYVKTRNHPDSGEVHGRIENSTLFLTWPVVGVEEKHKMIRDDSDNFILNGSWKGIDSNPRTHGLRGTVQFKKIK